MCNKCYTCVMYLTESEERSWKQSTLPYFVKLFSILLPVMRTSKLVMLTNTCSY